MRHNADMISISVHNTRMAGLGCIALLNKVDKKSPSSLVIAFLSLVIDNFYLLKYYSSNKR